MTSSKLCVVLWRANERDQWQVQPYTYAEGIAETVARRLLDQFRGQVWIWIGAPAPPLLQVTSDCEGEA